MLAPQITFLDFPKSEFIERAVIKRAQKLYSRYPAIMNCKVLISCPHRHSRKKREYKVEIIISLPKNDVVVAHPSNDSYENRKIYVAIRKSFETADHLIQKKFEYLRRKKKNIHPAEMSA